MNFVWIVEYRNPTTNKWRPLYKLGFATRDEGREKIKELKCTGSEYRCVKYVWNGIR